MSNERLNSVSTGLPRLDTILGGGLPERSLVVIAGVPGSGKTTLAFHIMAEAVDRGSNAMLVTTTHQPVSKLREQYSSFSFLGPTGALDKMEILEREPDLQSESLSGLLNDVVRSVQEKRIDVAVIDGFRAVSDVAQSRGQIWRFLASLSSQMVINDCIAIIVGEYMLPQDLDLPELAMADVVIYLEVERLVSSDHKTLRIYKMRGRRFLEGRQAFSISDAGIDVSEA